MNDLQKKVRNFCQSNNLNSSIEHRMLDLTSEVGELAKELLKISNYGSKPIEFKPEFQEELGDVFYSLITVANYFNIDMSNALEEALKKYQKRAEKGNIGSE